MQGGGDMKIEVHHKCQDYNSYRAARSKSLFNVESGCNFDLTADLPIDDDWRLGLIVGPSGSGKTSIGRKILGDDAFYVFDGWPKDKPVIDAIAPESKFDDVVGALSSVGLGDVPSWLRPYNVLSNGEQFRANLARVVCEAPDRVVIDEFTSVVDRQVAKIGAYAFSKAWKRKQAGKCVLLSCHYDIIDWLEPDWVYDIATGKYQGRGLWRRPKIELEIYQTNWSYWKMFEPHHYLKAGNMIAGFPYVGAIEGKPVAHIAFTTRPGMKEARCARFVVMPEYQGCGLGLSFMNHICQMWLEGQNRYGKPMRTTINTSHPGLCAALRRNPLWRQYNGELYGANKAKSGKNINEAWAKSKKNGKGLQGEPGGYGGHFRSTQGFRHYGKSATPPGTVGGGHMRAMQGFRYYGEQIKGGE
jgi:GNAT superfamily N-acetyltransferase